MMDSENHVITFPSESLARIQGGMLESHTKPPLLIVSGFLIKFLIQPISMLMDEQSPCPSALSHNQGAGFMARTERENVDCGYLHEWKPYRDQRGSCCCLFANMWTAFGVPGDWRDLRLCFSDMVAVR
jgi:hypothetical protein